MPWIKRLPRAFLHNKSFSQMFGFVESLTRLFLVPGDVYGFHRLQIWVMAATGYRKCLNTPPWSLLKLPQWMLPGNRLAVSLVTLSSVLSDLRLFGDLSRHCCWKDSWLFSLCFLCWDAEPFPKQSVRQCQVFSSPAAPNNGDQSMACSQKWRGSSQLAADSASKRMAFR